MPELLLLPIDMRRFLEEPRNAVILPAAVIVPFLSLWPYFASPFVPALIATYACLEPQLLNMWYLWPGQLEGLAVRPVSWKRTIAAKNLASLALMLCVFAVFAVVTLYFHAGKIAAADLAKSVLHCITGGLALTVFGNNYSIVSPRAEIAWTLTDMASAVLCMIIGVIGILPVIVLSPFIGDWEASGIAILLYFFLWAGWSLPRSAHRLSTDIPELWMSVRLS
jgi:hypothetical protein